MNNCEKYESQVRSYCRSFPEVFTRSKGSYLYNAQGKAFLDFFAGAGALNYGHNNDYIKERVIAYLSEDGISHALDMTTEAKEEFLAVFQEKILAPLGGYKVMFCGSTGTNAVEAALKLARKNTGRTNIFAFTGAFHGMTLGSLACTSGLDIREGGRVPLNNVTFMPYPSGFNTSFDTIGYMESLLTDDHSGIEKPAAVIVEAVQAEGGIHVAPDQWLKDLAALCKRHDILLIFDEIQIGCGRTGSFFSFEEIGVRPDLVTVSKSISGYGLPMSLLLIKDQYDTFFPAEHNGTFRGNQLAFVGAKAALEYRENVDLGNKTREDGAFVEAYLNSEITAIDSRFEIRGKGMIWGIETVGVDPTGAMAKLVTTKCFEKNLIIERAGRHDSVIKLLPPLTITREELISGMEIIKSSMQEVFR